MPIHKCELILSKEKKELGTRGSPMFPCGGYLSDLHRTVTGSIPWHWHDEMELLVVACGSVCIQLSDRQHILHSGEGAFINSNVLHSMHRVDNGECSLHSFVFPLSFICGGTESIIESKYMRPLTNNTAIPSIELRQDSQWQKQALTAFQAAYEAFGVEAFGYELFVRNELARVCHLIIRHMQPASEKENKSERTESVRVKEMLQFIHQAYAEGIDLKQIADRANISQRECLRCFQAVIGMSPVQYLIKHRISVAADLLTDTEQSITEIGACCGFASSSYFAETFRRITGNTPTAYRKGKG